MFPKTGAAACGILGSIGQQPSVRKVSAAASRSNEVGSSSKQAVPQLSRYEISSCRVARFIWYILENTVCFYPLCSSLFSPHLDSN